MKRTFALLFALLTTLTASAQNFEGIIVYANSYKSKMPDVPAQEWNNMLGTTQTYYLKGGQYKSVLNAQFVQWQLFRNQENKLYTKTSTSEVALWNDVTVATDVILKTEVKKNAAEVLGYKCDELTLTCKSGVQKFYFSSKLGVDPSLYVNHKFGNWYEMLRRTKAVPLKMSIEMPQLFMESVATSVKPLKLDDKLFELPAGMQTQKSPN
jgi:hypothetical protein